MRAMCILDRRIGLLEIAYILNFNWPFSLHCESLKILSLTMNNQVWWSSSFWHVIRVTNIFPKSSCFWPNYVLASWLQNMPCFDGMTDCCSRPTKVSVTQAVEDRQKWVSMASAECEPLRAEPPAWSRARAPGHGVRRRISLKLKNYIWTSTGGKFNKYLSHR